MASIDIVIVLMNAICKCEIVAALNYLVGSVKSTYHTCTQSLSIVSLDKSSIKLLVCCFNEICTKIFEHFSLSRHVIQLFSNDVQRCDIKCMHSMHTFLMKIASQETDLSEFLRDSSQLAQF